MYHASKSLSPMRKGSLDSYNLAISGLTEVVSSWALLAASVVWRHRGPSRSNGEQVYSHLDHLSRLFVKCVSTSLALWMAVVLSPLMAEVLRVFALARAEVVQSSHFRKSERTSTAHGCELGVVVLFCPYRETQVMWHGCSLGGGWVAVGGTRLSGRREEKESTYCVGDWRFDTSCQPE
jgi:hypothetical protein